MYSPLVNTDEYKKLRKKNKVIHLVIFLAVSAVLCTGIIISRFTSGTVTVAVCLAAVIITAVFSKPWLAFDRDWEGEVISKEKEYTYSKTLAMMLKDPKSPMPKDKQGNTVPFVKSILTIRKDDGKEFVYTDVGEDESPAVCYYRIGDRVRHHGGLKLCEKENKDMDRAVLCLRCLTLTPKAEEHCRNCGLTLLK